LNAVRALFGQKFNGMHHQRETLIRFRGQTGQGYVFWDIDPFTNEGGLLFAVWEPPPPVALLRHALPRLRLPPGARLFARNRDGAIIPLWGGPASSTMELLPHAIPAGHLPFVRLDDRTWVRMSAGDHTYYLGVAESPLDGPFTRLPAHAAVCIFGLAWLVWGIRWIVLGRDSWVSIRVKLLLLFLYALAIPFMVILALSYSTFLETGRSMTEDARKAGADALKAADDGFLDESQRFRRNMDVYRRLFRQPASLGRFQRLTESGLARQHFQELALRDGSGKVSVEAGGQMTRDTLTTRVMDQMFRDAAHQYVPDRAIRVPEPAKGALDDYLVESITESAEIGISEILNSPGGVRELVFPKFEVFFYWDFYSEPDSPAAFIAGSIPKMKVRQRYLQQTFLTPRSPGERGIRIFAVEDGIDRWSPEPGRGSSDLRFLALRVRQTQDVQVDRFSWQGRRWIAVGQPGRQLQGYSLIALVPEEPIQRTLAELRGTIFLGLLAAFVITLLLGWVLADTFLGPIGSLGRGLLALKARNTKFRLTSFQKDELGDLSHTFNEMMETLEEMSAGKQVQEQLFPKAPLVLGKFRVTGLSRPATHLGGDYFDYAKINENQLLVLIGDVTGHGIPAALIMAMSKAIVTSFAGPTATPEDLLTRLNATITAVMRRKRLMTLGLLWVDTARGEIRFFQHGHPLPLLWRPDGSTEFVEAKGLPVGVGQTFKVQPVSVTLKPGERLVLYTDGLVESLGAGAANDLFLVFQKFVEGQKWRPLEEACTALLQEHPFTKTGAAQPDDFTVVILECTAGVPAVRA
nr:SpoIIE family protein phosphatase [Candidatus Ozemobacteraceae bacterium]